MTTHTNAQPRQPWMHDMKALVCAPAQLWCDPDGTVAGGGMHAGAASIGGFYVADTRVVSSIGVAVDGEPATPLTWRTTRRAASVTSMVARNVDGPTVDPQLRLDERRELAPDALTERIDVRSAADRERTVTLSVAIGLDMATMQEVKGGAPSAAASGGAIALRTAGGAAVAEYGGMTVTIEPVGGETCGTAGDATGGADCGAACDAAAGTADRGTAPTVEIDVDGLVCTARWTLTVPARGRAGVGLRVRVAAPDAVVAAAGAPCPWDGLRAVADDSRVRRWVNASLDDLAGLRLSVPALPDDEFLAAGAPWFFTLFGRDSLWAARFLLPLTTRTAMGTLRTLAHFQATQLDAATNAEPGKIMHELRGEQLVSTGAFAEDGMSLPPLYYGTIDATPLWVITLAEALRWGAPEDEVRALLPNLEAALAWLRDWGDCDGDGFLEYVDRTGQGLSNQGWKDSGDSVRWNDGSIADGPIALCEVQGYAYQAAMLGADLLDRFGRLGGDEWRAWAATLKRRFNERFWVDDGRGRYPAIALDRDKRPVDALTSNIGHLLGTGILDERGVRDVAARLASPEMLSGYGVRTMSSAAGGYWPQSYHCGSVWAHDSAIVMNGLAAEGHVDEAVRIAEGLVRAAEAFDYQIPELYAGDALEDGAGGPAPYPAACHPQAWSAASSVAVAALLLGMRPDGSTHPVDSPLAHGLRFERG